MEILALYKSMVRPVAEFAAPAYHSLLNASQTGMLEQLQARAMKIIFGWNVSYRTALLETNTPRLEERRQQLVEKFAQKCVKEERFKSWFPLNFEAPYDTRRREKYKISRGRTQRFYRNPLSYMRKYLNNAAGDS